MPLTAPFSPPHPHYLTFPDEIPPFQAHGKHRCTCHFRVPVDLGQKKNIHRKDEPLISLPEHYPSAQSKLLFVSASLGHTYKP